jgi:hypothetical protein
MIILTQEEVMGKVLFAIFTGIFLTGVAEAKQLIGGNLDYHLEVSGDMVYLVIKNINPAISTEITGVTVVSPAERNKEPKKIVLTVTGSSPIDPSIKIEVGSLPELAKLVDSARDSTAYNLYASETNECKNCIVTPFGIDIKARYSNGLIQESLTGAYLQFLDKPR